MADDPRTLPTKLHGLPVKELRVEVVQGADVGIGVVAANEPISIGAAEGNTIVLRDRGVSRYHLELRRAGAAIRVEDLGSTNGTQIGAVTLKRGTVTVSPGAQLQVAGTILSLKDGRTVLDERRRTTRFGRIETRAGSMERVLSILSELARTDASVLLVGESGVGKEVVARALHEEGARSAGPFVTFDCAAITPSLFTSALFGHERGAFTGATDRHIGAFERADGGTLFLDEIGELPAELQARLLGVLERRSFQRVGGADALSADVRIVSATNRDLREEVNQETFRLDLYYRIAVVNVRLPALRDRAEDIPLLIEDFLREEHGNRSRAEIFSPEAMAQLASHSWPGNVRELRNAVAAACAIGAENLPSVEVSGASAADLIESVLIEPYRKARRTVTDEFERRYLVHLVQRVDGSLREAARTAKMDRSYLAELLRKHAITR